MISENEKERRKGARRNLDFPGILNGANLPTGTDEPRPFGSAEWHSALYNCRPCDRRAFDNFLNYTKMEKL